LRMSSSFSKIYLLKFVHHAAMKSTNNMNATVSNVITATSVNFLHTLYYHTIYIPKQTITVDKGDLAMIENVIEFFKNLPAKVCMSCGNEIDEQHECYGIKCDNCNIL